jgi:ABC-type lipoprotein release transport system permease subunit
VLLGVAGALPVTRLMSGLLHGIGAGDPPTYLQTALVLILAAATAAFFPARRAAAVDPADTLRER